MTKPELSEEQQFAQYFDEASTDAPPVPAPDDRGTVQPEPVDGEEPAPVVNAEPPAPPEPDPLAAATPADPEIPDTSGEDATWEARYKSLTGKFNQRERTLKEQDARIAELETRLTQLLQQPPSPPPADTAPAPPAADPEEEELLANYRENLPEVSRATEVMIHRYLKQEREKMRAELLAEIDPRFQAMEPVLQHTRQSAQQAHFAAITAAHPDWKQHAPNLPAWIETQPAYLQAGYRSVLEGGATDEVIDLLTRYKASTGQPATPKPQQKPAPDPRADAALAVRTRAPGQPVTQAIDPNDYESAWQEFART